MFTSEASQNIIIKQNHVTEKNSIESPEIILSINITSTSWRETQ